jgi:FkbM family methyltransferase
MIDIVRFFNKKSRFLHPEFVDIAGESGWDYPSFQMLACEATDQVACTAAARGWSAFEQPMPAVLRVLLANADAGIFVDVGANTGFYSLLALAVSAQTSVVSYEPLAPVRKILEKNFKLNEVALNLRRRAKISACAVSDQTGRTKLFVPDQGHGLVETSASLSATFKECVVGHITVRRTTLDAGFKKNQRVTFIKIDAEGHDVQVLAGAKSLLLRDRPIVFVEVLLGADEERLTSLLTRVGYVDLVMRPAEILGPHREVRHDTVGWNHIWLPEEQAEKHMKLLADSVGSGIACEFASEGTT